MLVVVLLLVLAAGGALVSAVVADHPQWAWLAVLFSVLGAALLVMRRTRAPKAAEAPSESADPERQYSERQPSERQSSEPAELSQHRAGRAPGMAEPANAANQTAAAKDGGTRWFDAPAFETAGAGAQLSRTRVAGASAAPLVDEEPGDEGTDATVLLQGSELDVEVVVIDERPRYHLARCRWLENRGTIPLPLREARSLGFTPCALCAPNAVLTRRARANRRGPSPS